MASDPSPDPRFPVILLTGFLGAGKTTLLLRWLREAPATGLRPGIVMNEFGSESVDAPLIARPDLPVVPVDGGCVCCAPDDALDRACRELVKSGRCDYGVLEASGLADPDSVIDQLTDPDLLSAVRLQAVVTVLDALWYGRAEEGGGERILARRQLQFAQVVALSRCDLLSAGERDAVEAAVREVNPSARIVRMPFGLPDLGEILRSPPAGATLEPEPSAGHAHLRFRSLAWRFPAPVDRPAFEAFLAALPPREVVRVKGFVRFRQSPGKLHVFQGVHGRHLVDEYPALPHPDPVAVLIGPDLDADRFRGMLRALVPGMRPGLTLSGQM